MSAELAVAGLMLALFALIHASDLHKQRSVEGRMEGILTRRGQDTLDEIHLLVRENQHVLGAYHGHARRLTHEGRHQDAARRMLLGCAAIEALAPDFTGALRALRRLARSVSVIVGVEPVRPGAFRASRLGGLAGLGAFLHHLLLTGRQRILLRLHVVSAGFRLALSWLRRATERLVARPADAQRWRSIDALVADLGTTGDEALVAARRIVQALDAAELGSSVVRRLGP